MLVGVPAAPQPEVQPPAADVVDGHRFLQQHRGMAERVARHQDAEPDPLRPRRDRGQQRPRLEDRVIRRPVGVDEVVDEPGVVEAEVFGHLELVVDAGERLVRLAEEEPEPQLSAT